jgi:hypothetical protein
VIEGQEPPTLCVAALLSFAVCLSGGKSENLSPRTKRGFENTTQLFAMKAWLLIWSAVTEVKNR